MVNDDRAAERKNMVECVGRHFAETAGVTGVTRMRSVVEAALQSVPRHRFVPPSCERLAYADSALSIGFGQTISQPFIVALMVELAGVAQGDRVLEVGTGSGYQAAILASLGAEVCTIELIPALAERAAATLQDQGVERVQTRCGDGFEGWPEAAPFQSILVTACSESVPAPLVEQLAVGGRMIIPVGPARGHQELQVIEKDENGEMIVRHGLPVAFVPLVHGDTQEAEDRKPAGEAEGA